MARGRFIAFEGGEGAGKSTQARLLHEHLNDAGIDTELTREPGGTPGAEAIRALLLDPPDDGWTPQAEALLFAAARADHVARRIEPALAAGRWVVSDRFIDSSRAYQGIAGGMGDEAIVTLHAFGSGGLRPDCTVLLTASAPERDRRTRLRDAGGCDAIGGRGAAYHQAVADAFDGFAKEEGFVTVAAEGPPQAVHAGVLAALRRRGVLP